MPIIAGPLPTVIYPKPREEQPAPQPQPSAEAQESQRFWTAQGYPQYAGRYKAIDLQGKQIQSVTETPEGLTITFRGQEQSMLPRTRGIQSAMQSILARSGSYLAEYHLVTSPEQPMLPRTRGLQSVMQSVLGRSGSYLAAVSEQAQLPSQELVRVEYPELKGDEPERFMDENVRAWTGAGFPQYGSVYRFPFGTGMPQGWRTKSIVLAPYGKGNELIWTIEQFATYELTPESQAAQTASRDFFTKIGYPQFGGQYAPFEVPSGFKVASVKETFDWGEGGPHPGALESKLAIQFEALEPTITQPMGAVKQSPISPSELRRNEYKDFGQLIADVKANAGTSSLTAIIEQYAETRYSKDVMTRTMQKIGFLPSQASDIMKVAGAVSTVESLINPNVPSLFELGSKSPEFIVGRLTGEAMLFAGTSELFSWVTRGTPSPIPWISEKIPETIKSPFKELVSPITSFKEEMSYQFHQHAPEWLLKATYGKEMGTAIAVERQWAWGKPVAEGTAGMLEEAFGMSFYRAETLHYAMPVLEWQRVTYMEWLAPRVAIESQWGWGKAVVGGTAGLLEEGFGMPFYRSESLHYSMPTLEWQRVKFTEWMAPRVRVESQWSWESEALGLKGGEPALTTMVKPEAFRAAESLHMAVATIRQPEQWYIRTSGFTRTPMEVTLQRATEDKMFRALSRGGLSATQELDVIKGITSPSPETFLTTPTRLYAGRDVSEIFAETALSQPYAQRGVSEAFMGVEQLTYAPRTSLLPFGLSLLGFMLKGESVQQTKLNKLVIPASLLRISQVSLQTQTPLQIQSLVSLQAQIPLQVQSQNQMLKQTQVQVQLLRTMQIQIQQLKAIQIQVEQFKTPAFKTPTAQQFKTPTFKVPTIPKSFGFPSEQPTRSQKSKKRVGKKRGQGLYLWEFPILDPEKVWKLK